MSNSNAYKSAYDEWKTTPDGILFIDFCESQRRQNRMERGIVRRQKLNAKRVIRCEAFTSHSDFSARFERYRESGFDETQASELGAYESGYLRD